MPEIERAEAEWNDGASTLPPEAAFEQPSEQPQVRDPERFTGHRVQLQLFEGPLDLLLYLVRAHRYDICDIPVADVTAQFFEFLRLMDELDLEYAGDFLVTAATLMQIKSRMLLPKHESANEEEIEDDSKNDPRRELVERLLEYQKFQEAADTLRGLRDERAQMWTRPPWKDEGGTMKDENEDENADASFHPSSLIPHPSEDAALLLQDISTFDLLRALQKVLDRQAERPVALVRREPFTLAERVAVVLRRLSGAGEGVSFGALCDDCQTRLEIVLTFLALLELINRKRILVAQDTLFDEIWVRANVPLQTPLPA